MWSQDTPLSEWGFSKIISAAQTDHKYFAEVGKKKYTISMRMPEEEYLEKYRPR